MNRRINPLLCQLSIEADFHVTRSFKLFKNHIVHSGLRLNQSSSENRQTPPFFTVASRSKKLPTLLKRYWTQSTRTDRASPTLGVVMATGKSRQTIQKQHHVFSQLYQTFRPLHHEVSNLRMTFSRLIKCRTKHLCIHGFFKVCHLFRAFIKQQYNQLDLGVVQLNRFGDLLEHNRLSSPRRCNDNPALSFSQRRYQIKHSWSQPSLFIFQNNSFIGKHCRETIESFWFNIIRNRYPLYLKHFVS